VRAGFLPYARPDVTDLEIASVVESLKNGWLTTGPRTAALEEAFARAAGVRHAVALNSCTAALHLGLLALGIGEGDEVVTPSLTFVAGAQCVLEVGARPVFCDVDLDTLSVSVETIEPVVTSRTKAIVVLPFAGRPLGIRKICDFARERGIAVIEDAAHAVGMLDRRSWSGVHSTVAAYSFYATKNVAAGEGGMLVTNDGGVADRVRRLSLHGMTRDAWRRYQQGGSWRYDVLEPGFKYNMPDIAAAVALTQFSRLGQMQSRREEIAAKYLEAIAELHGMRAQRLPEGQGDRHSWCMFPLLVDAEVAGITRDEAIERLRERNVGTSVHYIPTHHFSAYRSLATVPLPNTDRVAGEILSLPLYPSMSDRDVDDVIEALREVGAPRVPVMAAGN
jgi:dTDP-4-amino-4,6-dideoxygalactose transaminase